MKIVATSDTHTVVDVNIIPDGDVFIHAGDLMTTGYPDDWKNQLEWLSKLPHKMKIYVPGNHDFHMVNYPGPALQDLRKAGVICVGLPGNLQYSVRKLPNGMLLMGLPFVKNLPRWAFDATEEYVSEYLSEMVHIYGEPDIVVSHSPIEGIMDGSPAYKSGFTVYKKFLEKYNPKFWIHGHIHEEYGKVVYKNTEIYNVALCDRKHRHLNPPIVIDV